jgi:hypothetical protein
MSEPSPEPLPPPKGEYAGIWLPLEILEEPGLSLSEKIIFGVISALDSGKGFWMTNHALASRIGITPTHVSACVSNLARLGYISISQNPGGRRIIETVDRQALKKGYRKTITLPLRKPEAPLPKIGRPSDNKEERKDKRTVGVMENMDALFSGSRWKPGNLFTDAWADWIAYRKERKPSLTPSAATMQVEFIIEQSLDEKDAVEIIEQSIRNSWMGLFPLKKPGIFPGKPKIKVDYRSGEDSLS